jgi:hypothetical protein
VRFGFVPRLTVKGELTRVACLSSGSVRALLVRSSRCHRGLHFARCRGSHLQCVRACSSFFRAEDGKLTLALFVVVNVDTLARSSATSRLRRAFRVDTLLVLASSGEFCFRQSRERCVRADDVVPIASFAQIRGELAFAWRTSTDERGLADDLWFRLPQLGLRVAIERVAEEAAKSA